MKTVFVIIQDDDGQKLGSLMLSGDRDEIELLISVANRASRYRTYTITSEA